jgi:OOP family OmpA-OmpF porin
MKYTGKTLLLALCLLVSLPAWTQVDLLKKARQKTEKRTSKEVDKKLDKSLDQLFGTDKKKSSEENTEKEATGQPEEMKTETAAPASTTATGSNTENSSGVLNWAKYDFVPGDQVIFEDNLVGEENGEFPSRWDLQSGTAEVAEVDGENVIFLRGGAPCIVPYMENTSQDYLPDVFTIEYDIYFGYDYATIYLYDRKNQRPESGSSQWDLQVAYDKMSIGSFSSTYPKKVEHKRWGHVAIAYTDGKFKAYLDDTRLINIPRMEVNPMGISLYSYHASDRYPIYIKNIRIAKGGVKFYDRVVQDGKIVANGIRFDVGKASIRPESMGIINEVVALMNDHPELKFSVEGHTDSDGDESLNMELSQKRAESVMDEMIKLGISKDRLQAKGWGESKPVAPNASPEDKANNRRVEFVKL